MENEDKAKQMSQSKTLKVWKENAHIRDRFDSFDLTTLTQKVCAMCNMFPYINKYEQIKNKSH